MSSSVNHKFTFIAESTYGTTPVTPTFKPLPITGTTLALAKDVVESEVISPTRQVMDVRHGNRQVGGDVSAELLFGTFDDFLEALLCGTWTSNVLKPGTTRRSFSIMRQFTDLDSGAKPFHIFTGCELNTFSLSIVPGALIKMSFGVFGKNWSLNETAPTDTAYGAEPTVKPFDSFSGSILVDGSAVATVTEIQLSVENGIEPRWVVFQDTTNQGKVGKTRVKGQLTLHFESAAMLLAFNGAVKKSLEIEIIDPANNAYTIELPSVLPTGGQVDVSGESDVTIPWPFQAIYEQGAGTPDAIKITRLAD